MKLLEMKTITITEKGQIAIPKDMRKIGGFTEGTKIVLLAFDDHLELRPMKKVSEKIAWAMQSEKSLGKDWNSKEDEKAWKDL
jgi:AbrB family looped-hinge helix DNA binding protein